jgi:hypothetical protein
MDHAHDHGSEAMGHEYVFKCVTVILSFDHVLSINYLFYCSGGHDHGSVGRNADGSYYYTHGAFLGHIVPGLFFAVGWQQ